MVVARFAILLDPVFFDIGPAAAVDPTVAGDAVGAFAAVEILVVVEAHLVFGVVVLDLYGI